MSKYKTEIIIASIIIAFISLTFYVGLLICAKQANEYNKLTGASITTSQVFWLGDMIVTDKGENKK